MACGARDRGGPARLERELTLTDAIIRPGFFSDCLEALGKINQLNRETFTTAGGGSFHHVP